MIKKILFVVCAVLCIGAGRVLAEEVKNTEPVIEVKSESGILQKEFFKENISSSVSTKKEEVKKLQGFLINQNLLKIDGAPTGVYGPKTKAAVKELQQKMDVTPTGTVGPITRGKLNEIITAPTKSPDAAVIIPKEVTQTKPTTPTTSTTVTPPSSPTQQPEKILVKPTEKVEVVVPNPYIPRVMFWQGKVNQHIDLKTGSWMTDPDGLQAFAGAEVDKLTYCKMFYPKSIAVMPYMYETIDTWHNRGNVLNFTATLMSYRCVDGGTTVSSIDTPKTTTTTDTTSGKYIPRVMFWPGKVNQHINLMTGNWETDPDGLQAFAGAQVDHLTYCKMFYPNTVSLSPYAYEKIDTWHDRGNVGNYTATLMSYKCVQK